MKVNVVETVYKNGGENLSKKITKSVKVFTFKESLIGTGLIMAGFTYLIKKAFTKGVETGAELIVDSVEEENE